VVIIGRHFASKVRTPAEHVREMLLEAERIMSSLRGTGPRALELLHLLDQVADTLAALEIAGTDMRAERARFKAVLKKLHRNQGRFLAEAGAAFQGERAATQPDQARWWWFLDETLLQERRGRLRRMLIWALVVAAVFAVIWLSYDRFLAPPPGMYRASSGASLAAQGDLRAALVEFEAAIALDPNEAEYWLWLGVIHFELGEADDAEAAFENARVLYGVDFDFLVGRGLLFLRVGDLAEASADVERAISANPELAKGYFLRASIAGEQGDCAAAIADFERAADLAHAAGETWLEGEARVSMATLMQSCQQSTSVP
jgi:tetratricopeptide (TPR) repeat protein